MKTIITSIFLVLLIANSHSQKKYNRFNKPHRLIEFVDFKVEGMELKLSIAGIKYVQNDLKLNSLTVAKIVKKLHNKMVGGSSKLSEDCIASQIYYHVIFYDLKKSPNSNNPNRVLLKKVEKYVPISKIKSVARKFSNNSANPINANYVELNLRGCRQLKLYVVPPNIFK